MLELSTLIVSRPMLYLVRDKHSVNNTGVTSCAYCESDDLQGQKRDKSNEKTDMDLYVDHVLGDFQDLFLSFFSPLNCFDD